MILKKRREKSSFSSLFFLFLFLSFSCLSNAGHKHFLKGILIGGILAQKFKFSSHEEHHQPIPLIIPSPKCCPKQIHSHIISEDHNHHFHHNHDHHINHNDGHNYGHQHHNGFEHQEVHNQGIY